MSITGAKPDESAFEKAALDIIWSFQGDETRNDPTLRNVVKLLDTSGCLYQQTGNGEFGPYGTVLRTSLYQLPASVTHLHLFTAVDF